jgi:hypothetical protein
MLFIFILWLNARGLATSIVIWAAVALNVRLFRMYYFPHWAFLVRPPGGTMMAAMDLIVSRGATPANIRIVSIVAAPPALTQLSEKYKGKAP